MRQLKEKFDYDSDYLLKTYDVFYTTGEYLDTHIPEAEFR